MTIWKGREILDIALLHVGEDYILGARAPLNNANWRGPWDCAEFAEARGTLITKDQALLIN